MTNKQWFLGQLMYGMIIRVTSLDVAECLTRLANIAEDACEKCNIDPDGECTNGKYSC